MRRQTIVRSAVVFFAGTGLSLARAQTITAAGGNATFTFNPGAVPTTATGIGGGSSNLDINGTAAGGDQLFENWWWYRVHVLDTREYRYSAPANPFVVSGDTMTGSFAHERFKSEITYTITDSDGSTSRGSAQAATRPTPTPRPPAPAFAGLWRIRTLTI